MSSQSHHGANQRTPIHLPPLQHPNYQGWSSTGRLYSLGGGSSPTDNSSNNSPGGGRWNRGYGGGGNNSPTSPGTRRGGNLLGGQGGGGGNRFGGRGGSSAASNPSTPPSSTLHYIRSITGEPLLFNETNMEWNRLNIFRTRLCDRLTQMNTCHMANRCLFSHDIAWPRRTPFLPRATAPTLRYIPVWCPRLKWPPLAGVCDSLGKISWSSWEEDYDPGYAHSRCIRGDNCPFVHNLEEFLYHPEVYKTRMCCLANDENFGDDRQGGCAALCPWYFCPFAHYLHELRDVRTAKYTWHQPPQIVDNHYVARTQGFDDVELTIIRFVRTHSSLDLYTSTTSPLSPLGNPSRCLSAASGGDGESAAAAVTSAEQLTALRSLVFGPYLLPPVFRPIEGSSLEHLIANEWHREIPFDDLLYFMITASLMNLLLYPVENFYVPALLSLQCASLEYQLGLGGSTRDPARDCSRLLALYDATAAGETTSSSSQAQVSLTVTPSPRLPATATRGGSTPQTNSASLSDAATDQAVSPSSTGGAPATTTSPAPTEEDAIENILNNLAPDELLRVFQLFTASRPSAATTSTTGGGDESPLLSDKTTDVGSPTSTQPPPPPETSSSPTTSSSP